MLSKLSLTIIGTSVTLYLAACTLLLLGQARLIFIPDSQIDSTPREYGLNYQDIWFEIDGNKAHGWWIPSANKTAPVILYLHGNASNNGDLGEIAAIFYRLDVSVMLVDYRGYGKSSTLFPNEKRVYEDAEATWQYLTRTLKIKPQKIFVYGHSLGGAIAIELASKHPDMAGLIVEGTFTSIQDLAESMPLLKIFPLEWLITERFDSLSKISSLQTPLLILHGTEDITIPLSMSAQLFAAAPEPKQLITFEGANHNNLPEVSDREYLRVIRQFIQSVVHSNIDNYHVGSS